MTTQTEDLVVRSHVSRDLLQSAALFKNEHLAVWEYVSNGLQYVDNRTTPVVRVKLDDARKRISIKDNGRGMDFSDLKNFFVMHGENADRKAGRVGRGMFGTGKSAAFGIAHTLVLTTVRDRKRTKVSLSRSDIEAMTDGLEIPLKVIEREGPASEPNGTLVEIEGIHLRKLDQKRVIAFVERHLAHWPNRVTVWVNNHECQYKAPEAIRTETVVPDGELAKRLGKCALELSVAAHPLPDVDRGVSIFSNGNWHETTLAGSEGREMANFIFGQIDIPALDDDRSPAAPFDMSRSMKLNPENATVQAALAFIGSNIERLRKDLVAQDRRARASESAKRLAKQASEIAKLINEDFSAFRLIVAKVRAKARGAADLGESSVTGDMADDDFVFGSEEPAEILHPTGGPGANGAGTTNGQQARNLNPEVQSGQENDPRKGKRVGGAETGSRKPQGGFSIDFLNMGEDQDRAVYQADGRQIVINLDHPQFKAALGSGTSEDPTFRRLAYEVAFSEYAVAVAFELEKRNEYSDVTDYIDEIRKTINRVARRAASLYEAP
jgi:Histidine kinase-, DNA gyrase B-, and HSP90-like ATPase